MKSYLLTLLVLCLSLLPAVAQDRYATWQSCLEHRLNEAQLENLKKALGDTLLQLPYDLGEGAQLLALSDQRLSLRTSSVGRMDLQLLPLTGGAHQLAILETVEEPQRDARISGLSARQLPPLPTAEDYLRPLRLFEGSAAVRLRELLRPLHLILWWGDEPGVLLARPSILLQPEDKENRPLNFFIHDLPTFQATWQGNAFTSFRIR